MRVLYHAMHGTSDFLVQVHRSLRDQGRVEGPGAWVVFNWFWKARIEKATPGAEVSIHPDRLELLLAGRRATAPGAPGVDDAEFERAWQADRTLNRGPREPAFRFWVAVLARARAFVEQARPDIIVGETAQSLPCFAYHKVAREAGIPFAQITSARLNPARVEYHLGLDGVPEGLRSSQAPLADSLAWASSYLEKLRSRSYAGPSYLKHFKHKKIALRREDLAKGAMRLAEQAMGGATEVLGVGLLKPFAWKLEARRMSSWVRDKSLYPGVEVLERFPGKKKVLFPLHVTPEASTLTWAPEFSNMVETARRIRAALPDDWVLVIKEHPSVTSVLRPRAEIDALRAIPGAVLLGPYESNDELRARCDGVIVINSTMGMELMLQGRPVITIGKPFYDVAGSTVPCPNLKHLPEALERLPSAVANDARGIEFLARYYEATGPGIFGNPHVYSPEMGARIMERSNVEAVASFLSAKVFQSARPTGHVGA